MTPDVLLVGAGDLGAAVGLRLADLGHGVLALRRNASLVPAPLVGRSVDLTREAPDLSDVRPRLVVVALTARPRTVPAARASYAAGPSSSEYRCVSTETRPDRARSSTSISSERLPQYGTRTAAS